MRSSRGWTFGVIAFVVAGSVILGIYRHNQRQAQPDVRVTATTYPIAEFVRQVGGPHTAVTTLVQPGVEPHDYEPSARSLAAIYDSDIFAYNGAGLEPWIKKIQHDLDASNAFQLDTATGITAQSSAAGGSAGQTDPHLWLDPKLAIKQVENVRKALIFSDPRHTSDYTTRADAYTKKLRTLDAAFTAGLAHCATTTVITSHQFLGYVAADYGLNAVGIAGLSPDAEPSPQRLAVLTDQARAAHAGAILYEAGGSTKLSQTVAGEIGVKAISFATLESPNATQLKNNDYLTLQRQNLRTLQTALGCTTP